MNSVALSGADTININNRVLADLATGTCVELTFETDIANAKTGKNGNSIYALNETGKQALCKIHVLRGSSDDIYLNGLIAQQQLNFAGTVLNIGEFIKKIGDGQGNITNDTYILSGGIMSKFVDAKMNVEGEIEQSISMYTIRFTNAPRVLTS